MAQYKFVTKEVIDIDWSGEKILHYSRARKQVLASCFSD